MIELKGLEYSIIQNCNLSCPLCTHQSWKAHKKHSEKDRIINDLKIIQRQIFNIPTFKYLGGEPLLHPDIFQIMKEVKLLNISDNIILCTNGTLLKNVPEGMYDLINTLRITVYTRVEKDIDLKRIKELCDRHGVKLELLRFEHKEVLDFIGCSEDTAQERYNQCFIKNGRHCVSMCDGYIFPCAVAQAMPYWIHIYTDVFNYTGDCANINNPAAVENLFNKKDHLSACHFCRGNISW